ncbi:MAG: HD domain-containing protein [Lachnospiraceae bacterium]|jgi:hypothetical protein|uniref:HD domain-containing protein n=1 Tax=Candidatus Merdisoma sp. JLR.KK006 TaxID=3112626 RepID=UPI002FF24EF9|nr:HD domain-containing protein [Lachnospiraceae bacterium]
MNEERQTKLLEAMMEFDGGNPLRIQHFLKVWSFARQIGKMEGLDLRIQEILETAAIVHDIGIKTSMEKYGDCVGKHQEAEGPPLAEEMLTGLGYERAFVDRVAWLVGHHHTYSNVEELDHRILLEADFLVNSYESSESTEAIRAFMWNVFRTPSGIRLLKLQWGLD